jgi:hypothetical protein
MTPTPRFPIYIPSKSRAGSRLTMKLLDRFHLDYRVIVEAHQFDEYAAVIPARRLLVLDTVFQDTYETCDSYGRTKSLGPGPARNAAWADALARGFAWHWVMDDNIDGFYWRLHNQKIPAHDASPIVAMEDFVLRYTNIGMAGPNYDYFAKSRSRLAPFVTGTRIYSCNLIRNALPMRWRGRYNEDTDLSLRILKAGWNTVQFNAFLQCKTWTQMLSGGNTEAFYSTEGTLAKSAMVVALHPDCARLVWRFGRPHHHVDYGRWRKRALVLDPNAEPVRRWSATQVVAGDLS